MRARLIRIIEFLVCAALLAGTAALSLQPLLRDGQVPYSADSVLNLPPWESAATEPGITVPTPPGETTRIQHYLWAKFINDSAQAGDSILWKPDEGAGIPFYAAWRTRCLSPFTLPFYHYSFVEAHQLSLFLKLLMAGLSAFWAARCFRLQAPLALFVAISFQWSAPFILWSTWPLTDTIVWLPLWLAFAASLSEGRMVYWPYGGVVLALMLLGGDPEAIALAIAMMLFIVLGGSILRRAKFRSVLGSLGAGSLAIATGLCLAGVQLWPWLEFMGQADQTSAAISPYVPTPLHLMTILVPHIFHAATTEIAGEYPSDIGYMHYALFHVGTIVVVLLPLWFAVCRRTVFLRVRTTGLLFILATTCTVLTVAILSQQDALSSFVTFGAEHLLMANTWILALCAAAGCQAWLRLDPEETWRVLKKLPVYYLALLGVGGVGGWLVYREYRPSAAPLVFELGILAAFAAGVALLFAVTVLRPSNRLLGYGVSALAAAQCVWALAPAATFKDPDTLFPGTEMIEILAAPGQRFVGSEGLNEWPLVANGIPQLGVVSGISLQRHADYTVRRNETPRLLRRSGSTQFLLSRKDTQDAFGELRHSLTLDRLYPFGAVAMTDPGARPRAWMTHVGTPHREYAPEQLDGDAPPLIERAIAIPSVEGNTAEAVITPGESNVSVEVTVKSTPPGVLVLNDAFYPGWKATVNGSASPLFPVDVLFRGVQVGSGDQTIRFHFAPDSLQTGYRLTVGGAVLVLIGLLMHAAVRIRQQRRALAQAREGRL